MDCGRKELRTSTDRLVPKSLLVTPSTVRITCVHDRVEIKRRLDEARTV
jgi:hypothetical protein